MIENCVQCSDLCNNMRQIREFLFLSEYREKAPTGLKNSIKARCGFMYPGKLCKICIFKSFHRLQVVKSVNMNKLLIFKKCLKTIDFVLEKCYNIVK